jgi:hypothetical protein
MRISLGAHHFHPLRHSAQMVPPIRSIFVTQLAPRSHSEAAKTVRRDRRPKTFKGSGCALRVS